MTETTLYKDKRGKTYRLNDDGKAFIDRSWKHLTYNEMAEVIGLSKVSIQNYMRKKGYKKRAVGNRYKSLNERVEEILTPYSGKLQYNEMLRILEKEGIVLTRDQLYLHLQKNGIASSYGLGYIRVFIDRDRENLSPENIVMLTKREFKCLSKIDKKNEMTGDLLLAAIELARLRARKGMVNEVYIATNKRTGEVIEAKNHTTMSLKLTKRAGQYKDCKSIGEHGERYIRDWVVTRKIKKVSNERGKEQ